MSEPTHFPSSTTVIFDSRVKSGGYTSKMTLLAQVGFECLPSRMLELLSYLPIKKFSQMRKTRNTIAATSERLVRQKADAHMRGLEGEKDLLSLLVRANAVEEPRWKLSDSEVKAEIASVPLLQKCWIRELTIF